MTVSIAMATYNGGEYLREQLDSFVRQTQLPNELVVCDDLSRDQTIVILEQFSRRAPFDVRVYRNEKTLGFPRNFGKAISLCRGNMIFLSDQDDVWYPEKIAFMSNVLSKSNTSFLAIHDLEIADQALRTTGFTVLGQNRAMGYSDEVFNFGCGMAFHAGIRPLVLPIPESAAGHDMWINTIAIAAGARFLVDKPLMRYRRHGANSTQWTGSKLRRVGWVDQYADVANWAMAEDYTKGSNLLGEIERRLEVLGPDFYEGLSAAIPIGAVLERLRSERNALATRAELAESSWVMRKALAAAMWARGDYRYFRGWRSFAKDLLR